MYPIVWFAIMTALCVVYAERANTRLGPQKRYYIDWPHATSLALVVIIVGFFVAQHDLNTKAVTTKASSTKTTTTTTITSASSSKSWKERQEEKKKKEKEEKEAKAKAEQAEARQRARERAVVAFHAVGITFAMWAALIFWCRERWYPYVLALAMLIITTSYYEWAHMHFVGNFVLMMVAVGFSLLGRVTTKRGFIVAYVLLMLFDMYSVWGSDIMSRIVSNYPGAFPKFLEGSSMGLARGIGAGDVIFAAIACNHIHQHCGVRRAAFFAFVCTALIPWGFATSGVTPLLIFVSPVAIAVLLFPKKWGLLRID